ncbi:hypothetical protein B0H19DRAFT_1379103 [Mycena capillaripes]|nr:hypothetical protein B0H19DRAFT_1379103 [Mycena capillaripes]
MAPASALRLAVRRSSSSSRHYRSSPLPLMNRGRHLACGKTAGTSCFAWTSTAHRAHARHPAATLAPRLLRIAALARPPTAPIVMRLAVRIVDTGHKNVAVAVDPRHARPIRLAPGTSCARDRSTVGVRLLDDVRAGLERWRCARERGRERGGKETRRGISRLFARARYVSHPICLLLPPWLILYPAPSVVLGSVKFLLALHTDGRRHASPPSALSTAGAGAGNASEYLDPGRYDLPSSIHPALLYITLVSPSTLATVAKGGVTCGTTIESRLPRFFPNETLRSPDTAGGRAGERLLGIHLSDVHSLRYRSTPAVHTLLRSLPRRREPHWRRNIPCLQMHVVAAMTPRPSPSFPTSKPERCPLPNARHWRPASSLLRQLRVVTSRCSTRC